MQVVTERDIYVLILFGKTEKSHNGFNVKFVIMKKFSLKKSENKFLQSLHAKNKM